MYLDKKARYEVIKFIEHGGRCRLTMDYIPGELLMDRVRRNPQLIKSDLLEWFRLLVIQLEQYHRYSKNQCYRYLNPYSILITEEKKPILLDLTAESNEFVLKNLQQRPMRQYFFKITAHAWDESGLSKDLYSLGKTMQFVLAHAEVEPTLTRYEEYKLSKVIEKCLGENPKKQYQSLAQIQKELPRAKEQKKMPNDILMKGLAATLVILLLVVAGRSLRSSSSPSRFDEMLATYTRLEQLEEREDLLEIIHDRKAELEAAVFEDKSL